MPKTYVHRPTQVEAIQLTAETVPQVQEFVGEGNLVVGEKSAYVLHSAEGEREVNFTDYLIKGVLGVFYPCSAPVFEESYVILVKAE